MCPFVTGFTAGGKGELVANSDTSDDLEAEFDRALAKLTGMLQDSLITAEKKTHTHTLHQIYIRKKIINFQHCSAK